MGVNCAYLAAMCAASERQTSLRLCEQISHLGYLPGMLQLVEQDWARDGALNPAVPPQGGEEQLWTPPVGDHRDRKSQGPS